MVATDATARTSLADPHEALASLLDQLESVAAEPVALEAAAGRVLAEPVKADRPSPACDVSAMDGYAVRCADLGQGRLPIWGEVMMGQPPPAIAPGTAVRIFTGGAVPDEADAVVRREAVTEQADAIELPDPSAVSPGANIRRTGENLRAGRTVAEAGAAITSPVSAALANFGFAEPRVHRPVRVTILTSGDELLRPDREPTPWQLRDSNTAALRELLAPVPWVSLISTRRASDELNELTRSVEAALDESDLLVLTGGVSMGDDDYVPKAIERAGGRLVFHKAAIRPGKPLLGAVGDGGRAIFGLPGNPVSAMVTARRFVTVALRRLAGLRNVEPVPSAVTLENADERALRLWWFRPARRLPDGRAALVPTMGSGDLVAAAASDGFVEFPPGGHGAGPWPFYPWQIGAIT